MSRIYFKVITSQVTSSATSTRCIYSNILMANIKVLSTNNIDFIVLYVSYNLMKAVNPVYRKICFAYKFLDTILKLFGDISGNMHSDL